MTLKLHCCKTDVHKLYFENTMAVFPWDFGEVLWVH